MPNQELPTNGQGSAEPDAADALIHKATDPQLNALAIERLSQAFETSAKRWELIVYPSLFAFIILAAYGFYLIFSLARDVHSLSLVVERNMMAMSGNMQSIADNISHMNVNIQTMAMSVDSMATDVNTLAPMLVSMQNMDRSMQSMTLSTASMRHDMAGMNQSVGRPMHFMNQFMPW